MDVSGVMTGQVGQSGSGMYGQLLGLLEYRVVLGALATTLDGLVVAAAGIDDEDAEVLAAAASMQVDAQGYWTDTTRGGVLHVLRGSDMCLVMLTETAAPADEVTTLMRHTLAALEASIAV